MDELYFNDESVPTARNSNGVDLIPPHDNDGKWEAVVTHAFTKTRNRRKKKEEKIYFCLLMMMKRLANFTDVQLI